MSKRASKSVYTSNVVVSPEPSSPTPSTSSAMQIQDKTEQDPDDPTPADEGDIHMEYSSDQFYSLCIEAGTKTYL